MNQIFLECFLSSMQHISAWTKPINSLVSLTSVAMVPYLETLKAQQQTIAGQICLSDFWVSYLIMQQCTTRPRQEVLLISSNETRLAPRRIDGKGMKHTRTDFRLPAIHYHCQLLINRLQITNTCVTCQLAPYSFKAEAWGTSHDRSCAVPPSPFSVV